MLVWRLLKTWSHIDCHIWSQTVSWRGLTVYPDYLCLYFYTKVLRQTWMSQILRVLLYNSSWLRLKNHLRQFKTNKMKSKGTTYTHSHTQAGKVNVCSIWVIQPVCSIWVIQPMVSFLLLRPFHYWILFMDQITPK